MKCPKCQFDNFRGLLYCGKCGTRLYEPEETSVSSTKTLYAPAVVLGRGSLFAGRYEVIEEIGRGGMGAVFRVVDKKINEEVALKVLKPEISSDGQTIERFKNELKLARKITHKNVCRMYDLNEAEGVPYITMEFVAGEDLKSLIGRAGRLSIEKAVSIARQICEGLIEAHNLGVVHRDLKPQNIMIDRKGNARIMDFGIARTIGASELTEAGAVIGTPHYISPEQVEGKAPDQRTDIYALGVILYEMVTGQLPFQAESALSLALKHLQESPRSPRELNPTVPESLSRLIIKCLEKDREQRYQSAGDLLSALSKIQIEIGAAERLGSETRYKPPVKPKKEALKSIAV
ncbi:MAG: protein kinase, partial [Candidatus Aminicenantes bacterium]|nr:protein kinase [Candidatus Aminicenantes bacterium]